MSTPAGERPHLTCVECGFAAQAGDDWETVDARGIGTLTRCPECGTTNVQHTR